MKKKTALWAGFLILLLILLLCTTAGAEQPTSWNINPWGDNLHDLSLGQHYTFNNRRISLSQMSLNVSITSGSSQAVPVPMVNTYYELADDVILIRETTENAFDFTGRPETGKVITLSSAPGIDVIVNDKNDFT